MRIDKYLSDCGICSRREASAACAAGRVRFDGRPAKKASEHIDPARSTLTLDQTPILYRKYHYILLNKPQGVVSATEDKKEKTVLDLLPGEYARLALFPCGRLDKNTTGLVLLTDDGPLAHRLLSPRSHVEKEYCFTVKFPLSGDAVSTLESGVDIGERAPTKPCRIRMDSPLCGHIILTEGKYHQIKRMMETVGNKITALHRERFGPLCLQGLPAGETRVLSEAEIAALQSEGEA